jgi:hypothetical protein
MLSLGKENSTALVGTGPKNDDQHHFLKKKTQGDVINEQWLQLPFGSAILT